MTPRVDDEDRLRKRLEHVYRDHFAQQMGGRTEVRVRLGRVDVVIPAASEQHPSFAVEVEPARTWGEGVRQAIFYAHALRREKPHGRWFEPAVAVYGDIEADRVRWMFERARALDVTVFVLRGAKWNRLNSSTCRRAYLPKDGLPIQPRVKQRRPQPMGDDVRQRFAGTIDRLLVDPAA